MPARPVRIRIGRLHLGDPQRAQNLEAGHVGQVQVEQDDVVIVELAEIDALFAQIGGVDVEAFGLQHQLDGLSGGAVVLNQQNAHASPLPRRAGLRSARRSGGPQKRFGTNQSRTLTTRGQQNPIPTACTLGRSGCLDLHESGFFPSITHVRLKSLLNCQAASEFRHDPLKQQTVTMINDAGKHEVKNPRRSLPGRQVAPECVPNDDAMR